MPIREYNVIVVGKAKACPITCCRWLRAKRVKSGMFKDTVAQNPTVAFRAGTRNFRNSAKLLNFDGDDSMGPKPPALRYAHPNNSRPTANRIGALMPCRNRMYSMPLRMTARFINQKARKQIAVL